MSSLRNKYLLLLALVFVLSDSCKKNDSDNNTPPEEEPAITAIGDPVGNPVTKTIGTAGGTLSSPDGRLKLDIPSGALTGNTDITIQPVTNTSPGSKGLAYNLLPDGTKFNKPATITFNYTAEELPDNLPFFLCIVYQDKAGAWIPDWELRDFDTVAKTVSMPIDHFTIFSLNNGIEIKASPLVLRKNEKSGLFAIKTITERNKKNQPLIKMSVIPKSQVKAWKVNGVTNGNATDGTIAQTEGGANYQAPDQIDKKRTVRISALLEIKFTLYDGKRKIGEYSSFEPGIDITLEPDKELSYTIQVNIVDSTISPFYGGPITSLPVYMDDAKFEFKIKFGNNAVQGTLTDTSIKNSAPTVSPSTTSFQGTTFKWISDQYGMIDISAVSLQSYNVLPADSVISLSIIHTNAHQYGVQTSSTENGTVFTNSPPRPYGYGIGFPQTIEIDLKRKDPYIKKTGVYGTWMYISIVPK